MRRALARIGDKKIQELIKSGDTVSTMHVIREAVFK
jgi:hypothetical protein